MEGRPQNSKDAVTAATVGKGWLRSTLAIVALFLTLVTGSLVFNPLHITWTQLLEKPGDRVELFFGFEVGDYSPAQRVQWNSGPDIWLNYNARLLEWRPIRSIRIDPSQIADQEIQIGSVDIRSRWGVLALEGRGLGERISRLNDLEFLGADDGVLKFHVIGADPQFHLVVPRELVWPSRGALFLTALFAAGFAVLVVIGGVVIFPRALARAGAYVSNKGTGLNLFIALIAITVLLLTWLRIAEITPYFQGPDEGAHIANAFHGFSGFIGNPGTRCGEVPSALNAVHEHHQFMTRRFTQQLTPSHVQALADLRAHVASADHYGEFEKAKHESCMNFNIINGWAYNLVSFARFQLDPNSDIIDWLRALRQGQVVIAALLVGMLFIVIIKGRYWLSSVLPVNEPVLRLSVLLGIIAYLSMPQNLFLFSVVNRDAYLVPLGLVVFVSFFFYVRWLTPALVFLAAYAFWPIRAPYLLLILLLCLWYVAIGLYARKKNSGWLFLPGSLVVGAFVSAPLLLLSLSNMRERLPLPFPGTLAVQENFWHFHQEVLRFVMDAVTLSILQWSSFFGLLGSLDTPVAKLALQTYGLLFSGLLGALVFGIVAFRRGFLSRLARLMRSDRFWGFFSFFGLALPLTVGAITYSGYQVYVQQGIAGWSSEVQGRYFLPVYVYVFVYYFMLALAPWLAPVSEKSPAFTLSDRYSAGLGFVVVGLLGLLSITVVTSVRVSLVALEERYFLNAETLQLYLEAIR